MKISNGTITLIKQFEGVRLTAYKAVSTEQYWTIGYGHYGADVKQGMSITQEQAEQYLKEDLEKFEARVSKYSSYNWNQNEFDALVSFAYNVGSIDQLTANGTRDRTTIANKMLEYNKSGGKVLAGLTRRRTAERALFLTPVETVADVVEKVGSWVQEPDGRWWYKCADGSYITNGWKQIDGKWYYFDAEGYMRTGWKKLDGKWYYLERSGAMVADKLLRVGEELFAFGTDGHMLRTNDRGALI